MLPCSLVFISGSRHSWWNVPIFRSGKTVWNLPTDPALVSVDFLRKGVDTAPTHADLETWAETGTHSFVVLSRKTFHRCSISSTYFYIFLHRCHSSPAKSHKVNKLGSFDWQPMVSTCFHRPVLADPLAPGRLQSYSKDLVKTCCLVWKWDIWTQDMFYYVLFMFYLCFISHHFRREHDDHFSGYHMIS